MNPTVPEDLAAVVDQLLAKKPEDRIPSAAGVAEMLDAVLAQLPADRADSVKAMRTIRMLPWMGRSWFHLHAPLIAGILIALNILLLASELTRLTQWTVLSKRDAAPATLPRLQLPVGAGPIWSVAFTSDGSTLALGTDDGTVHISDARQGKLLSQFKAQFGPVWSVAVNERAVAATGGDDPSPRLWGLYSGKEIEIRPVAQPARARALAFSPNGRRVVVGTRRVTCGFTTSPKGWRF